MLQINKISKILPLRKILSESATPRQEAQNLIKKCTSDFENDVGREFSSYSSRKYQKKM